MALYSFCKWMTSNKDSSVDYDSLMAMYYYLLFPYKEKQRKDEKYYEDMFDMDTLNTISFVPDDIDFTNKINNTEHPFKKFIMKGSRYKWHI